MADQLFSRALWLEAKHTPVLRERKLESPQTGEQALIKARFGAISRGTERLVSSGEVPPKEYERMRAPFQEGEFPFPVKYGYAVAGSVVEGPAELFGRMVFCLHPHQDQFAAPVEALRPIPDGVPVERAVMAANMETALNIVWDAAVQPGDRVAVVGAGLVGLLVGHLASSLVGTKVTLVDPDGGRADPAAALGVELRLPEEAPEDCDIVIHASGSGPGLATALGAAGFEGRVVEASWYGDREVSAPLGEAFHSRRLTLLSSQVGHVPPARRARWSRSRRLDLALELLREDRLDALISGETNFAELPEAYVEILKDPRTLCHRIRY